MERRLVKIGEAAAMLGTAAPTLRKWEATGELLPARKTKGGTRYYAITDLLALGDADAPTLGYARNPGLIRQLEQAITLLQNLRDRLIAEGRDAARP